MSVRRQLAVLALAGLAGVGVAPSGASFTAHSANSTNRITSGEWALGVILTDPGAFLHGSVALTATVTGGTVITAVRFQIRASDSTGSWQDVCIDATAPYTCTLDTTRYAADLYDLRATATSLAGATVVSAEINDVQIDNALPSVSLTAPVSPLGSVATLTASAADADSGVARVVFQRSPAGQNTWTEICTDTDDPFSCAFDTTTSTTPNGSYDLRATATDNAGNVKTSSVLTRTIDNTAASIALADPGAYLRGSVALVATVVSPTGVQAVAFQRAPAGTTTWTTICTDATAPFGCAFDTTAVADGLYDLRAVLTPASGAAATSTVTGRRVDNAPLRGLSVDATNVAGGHAGKIEAGDTLTLTWSDAVMPSTLVPGWSGTGAVAISVAVRDAANNADTLDFAGTAPGLGTVALRGNYIKSGKTATLGATAVLSGSGTTLTITLGAVQSGSGLRTWSNAATLLWTPSATATNLAGAPASTAPVTEGGAADKNF